MSEEYNNFRCYGENEKILLMLAPFWAPLIPPLGSSCIKSYIKKNGYNNVKIIDANLESKLWEMNSKYLNKMKKLIPEEKRGNFNMVAYDIFMNHLMIHINYSDECKYIELVNTLIKKNFFVSIEYNQIKELNNIVEKFYTLYKEYILELIDREKPVVLGITVYSVSLAPAVFTFRIVKEYFPQIMTVMGGGVFADQLDIESPNFKTFLGKTPFIDRILVGEGENLFLKLLRNELTGEKKVFTLKDIDGLVINLDNVDLPDYSDLDVSKYTQLASYTSRSCPYQCSFCSETVQWGTYRKKDAKKVVDELVQLKEMYGKNLFLLGDSLVNPIVTELSAEMVKRDEEIYWDAYLRADKPVCDPENTKLWRQGGFYRARLGIESGSQNVLNLMNKKITPLQIKQALQSLAHAGIKTTTYWVIGHPGETEEDFQETLEILKECRELIYEADWHPFYFFPTGQTNSEKWANENKIKLLYPEDATDMLLTKTWVLETKPGREEIYDRLRRFEKCCKELEIPNPYSLMDIYLADERWKSLHKNAVPSLVDF
jgi:radical SAM superfamily enzyme YgiQ (UPF0313 family)